MLSSLMIAVIFDFFRGSSQRYRELMLDLKSYQRSKYFGILISPPV